MIYSHLAHVDIAGYYQFITFRTNDSTDAFLNKLSAQNTSSSRKQLIVDNYLDRSIQGAYLNDDVLLFLHRFLRSKGKDSYNLIAFAIMPNHIHLLLKPFDNLPSVIKKIKGGSAKIVNEMMNRNGTFWAKNYYDKAIIDQRHFEIVYEYIKNNPLKLAESESSLPRFYGIYE